MNLRFKTAAGFLTAATLLGGSLQADAPRFVPGTGLTTVIISDRTEAPADPAEPFDNWSGPGTSTELLFRYSNAYDILQEVDLQGNNPEDIKILFNEFFDESQLDPTDRSLGVLRINDQRAFADGVNLLPTLSDFATAPTLADFNTPLGYTTGALSFFNRDFSGDDISSGLPGALPGAVSGDPLTQPQERLVQLYIGTDSDFELTDNIKSFFVITSLDADGDSVEFSTEPTIPTEPTAPVSPWVSFIPETNDFSNFVFFGEGLFLTLPTRGRFGAPAPYTQLQTSNSPAQDTTFGPLRDSIGTTLGDLAGVVNTPAGVPAPGQAIGLTVPPAKVATAFWGRFGITFNTNTVYELRTAITRTTAGTDNIRLSFGDEFTIGVADALYTDDVAAGLPRLPLNSEVSWRSYLSAKGGALASVNSGFVKFDVIGYGFASTNPTAANRGAGYSISSYEVRTTDRAALELLPGTTIVYNRGGAIPAAAANEIALPPAATAPLFSEANTTPAAFVTLGSFNIHEQNANTITEAGDGSLNFNINPRAAAPVGPANDTIPAGQGIPFNSLILYSGAFATSNPLTGGLLDVEVGKLYAIDVWLSSAQTGDFPAFRVFPRTAISQADSATFPLATNIAGSGTAIGASPRAYSSYFTPQPFGLGLSAGDTVRFVPTFDFLQVDDRPNYATTKTVRIHRIVVTEFPPVALD